MTRLNLMSVRFVLSFGIICGSISASAQERPLVPTQSDLYRYHRLDTQVLDSTGVQDMNKRDLNAMIQQAGLPIDNPNNRLPGINSNQVQSLIDDLNFHPVVGYMSHSQYDPLGGIGFCFGRALYIHLLLLHLGVDNDAIRKVWAVGPMDGGGITWGFHVATFVRATEEEAEGWWVVDNFTGRVMSLTEWTNHMFATSLDGNLRFYFSEAKKFSVSMGKYDPFQMGVHLPEQRDVYRNYFTDIMNFFREKKHVGRYPLLEKELQESLMAQANSGVRLETGLLDEGFVSASRSVKKMPQLPLLETDLFESIVAETGSLPPGSRGKRTCELTILNSISMN